MVQQRLLRKRFGQDVLQIFEAHRPQHLALDLLLLHALLHRLANWRLKEAAAELRNVLDRLNPRRRRHCSYHFYAEREGSIGKARSVERRLWQPFELR